MRDPHGEGVPCLIIDSLPPGGLSGPVSLYLLDSKDIWQVKTWLQHWIPRRPGVPGPRQTHPSGKKGKRITSQTPFRGLTGRDSWEVCCSGEKTPNRGDSN